MTERERIAGNKVVYRQQAADAVKFNNQDMVDTVLIISFVNVIDVTYFMKFQKVTVSPSYVVQMCKLKIPAKYEQN